ncbi:cytochrome P450 [Streptomyces griseofuscus]|uniref:cytochrome P450 n=1 Tax=Streptomyces griseofuscus TaxID=146922 RepID=UPI00368F88D0
MPDGLPSLVDPDLYARGDPHAVWRALRRSAPVFRHDRPGEPGFWAVTSHAVGHEVLTDWRRFTSTRGTFLRPDPSEPYPGAGKLMVMMDPPRHDAVRRAASTLFTVPAAAAVEEEARTLVRTLIERVLQAGECDFATDVAERIPLALSAGILGVPAADVEWLGEATSTAAHHAQDVGGATAQEAHYQVLGYYLDVLERRRAQPGSDLTSVLLELQRREPEAITDEEIVLTCDNVLVAASETTRNVAASGLVALLEHPAQWQALVKGRVSFKTAVEELLRWSPPVLHTLRTCVADTELTGVPLAAGDPVVVWTGALNRDEAVFEDPDVFRIDRRPNRHLSFGAGAHFCLGAPLARLILRVLFQELAERTPRIELAGPPQRLASYVLGGFSSVPVRVASGAAPHRTRREEVGP